MGMGFGVYELKKIILV